MSHTLPAPFRRFPLWWLTPPPFPLLRGHYGRWAFESIMFMAITAENHTTGLRPWKCTPSVAYGDVSPRESVSHDSQSPTAPYESCSLATPEGEILAALYLELLMNSNAERRENFPLRGKWCAAPKGVHFQRAAGAVVWFAIGRSPAVKVLGREAAIIIAPLGATTTLGPKGRQP